MVGPHMLLNLVYTGVGGRDHRIHFLFFSPRYPIRVAWALEPIPSNIRPESGRTLDSAHHRVTQPAFHTYIHTSSQFYNN